MLVSIFKTRRTLEALSLIDKWWFIGLIPGPRVESLHLYCKAKGIVEHDRHLNGEEGRRNG